jgi:hypothetical protein
MPKVSSMRGNALLDTSHNGPPHPFQGSRAVADSLTGIHSEMVCLSDVSSSCIHSGLHMSPQVNILEDWSPVNVEVIQPVLLYISTGHNKSYRKHLAQHGQLCWSTIMHVPHWCSDCQWYISQWIWQISCLQCWPVSRCDRAWGPTKQSATILQAH